MTDLFIRENVDNYGRPLRSVRSFIRSFICLFIHSFLLNAYLVMEISCYNIVEKMKPGALYAISLCYLWLSMK